MGPRAKLIPVSKSKLSPHAQPWPQKRVTQAEDEQVLVMAPTGHDAIAITELLNARGFQSCICQDPRQMTGALTNTGALVMTEEALGFAPAAHLLQALKTQPPWSELPVIIFTSGRASQLTRLLDVAAEAAGSVTLLERPIGTDTLVRTIEVALRSRRRQYQVRDLIEQQKRIQETLRQSEEQLQILLAREQEMRQTADEANRLKDEFLATMSHELRNPLNVILGYSEFLLRTDEINKSPQLLRVSEALRRNALSQSHLIRDLLEFSRLRSGKLTLNRETVAVMTVINHAVETVRAEAEAKQIAIEIHAPDDALFVDGDALRLEQIVWNLLNNAVKFTPTNGQVSVGVKREENQVVLTVEDTGQGINLDFLPHVFEMFRQGDGSIRRAHAGMGIGLALVRQLVELHDGSVAAYSEGLGKGAQFTVRLPEKSEPALPTSIVFEDSSNTLNQMAILVVDDDEDTTAMLRYMLEMSGATVIMATSGLQALRIAGERDFDVVLSDISMPGMDGFEFVRRLHSMPGKMHLPVFALTGFGRPEDIKRARDGGFVAHLTKPLNVETLLAFLQKISFNNHQSDS